MQERFYGMTPIDVSKLVFDFAEQQHVNHPFDASEQVAGEDGLNGFLKRYSTLSIRKLEATSTGRAVRLYLSSVMTYSKCRSDPLSCPV